MSRWGSEIPAGDSREEMALIFEPFYTTKIQPKGTELRSSIEKS